MTHLNMEYCPALGLRYRSSRAFVGRHGRVDTQHLQASRYYPPEGVSSSCRHVSLLQLAACRKGRYGVTWTVAAAAVPGRADSGHSDEQPPAAASQGQQRTHPMPRSPRLRWVPVDSPADQQRPEDNPSLDDIILDEQYYKEMGLTEEEVREALRQYDATELDPEGRNLGPGSGPVMWPSAAAPWAASSQPGGMGGDGAEEWRPGFNLAEQEEDEEDGGLYGPEAVLLAGFRPEEHGVARALLDSAGGHVIKVLPVTETMLYGTVDEAVHTPEIDWAAPRAPDGARGGGWGAQRTVLFSGLGFRVQLTVLELLESSGLPAVCAAVAREDQAGRRLGEVLAEAVAAQRSKASRLPKEDPWQAAGSSRFADARRGLPSLEELIGERAMERVQQLQAEAEAEAAEEQARDAATTMGVGQDADPARFGMDTHGRSAAGPRVARPEGGTVSHAGAAAGAAGPQPQQQGRGRDQPPGQSPQPQPRFQQPEPEEEGEDGMGLDQADYWRPDGPVLSPSGQRAAEEAAAEWEAWRTAVSTGRWPALDSGDLDPESDPNASLSELGMDLEQLRERVIRQLSDMDPEALEEYLTDSPYEDTAGKPLFRWGEVEDEDGEQGKEVGGQAGGQPLQQQGRDGRGSPLSSSAAPEAAGTAAGGVTWDELQRVAERQRQHWLEAQESMEAAAAAAGQLVVEAESQLLGPEESAKPQSLRAAPAAAPPPGPTPRAASTAMASSDTATSIPAALRPSTPPPTSLLPPTPLPSARQQESQQQQRRQYQQPDPPTPSPSEPEAAEFDPLGFGDAFSDLDDLLSQLQPAPHADAAASTTDASGRSPAAAAAGGPPYSASAPSSSAVGAAPSAGLRPSTGSGSGGRGALAVEPPQRNVNTVGPDERWAPAEPAAAVLAASGAAPTGMGSSILQQVQAAVRSGAPPEVIQKMLDELYGSSTAADAGADAGLAAEGPPTAFAAQAKPAAVITPENPLNATAPKKRRGSLFSHLKSTPPSSSSPSASEPSERAEANGTGTEATDTGGSSKQRRPRRIYGPAPPPEPDPVLKPLLQLRPEIAKAVQDKKVRFMDLSRLNDKQKRQFVEYQARLKAQRQQQQQQQQQEPRLEQQPQQSPADLPQLTELGRQGEQWTRAQASLRKKAAEANKVDEESEVEAQQVYGEAPFGSADEEADDGEAEGAEEEEEGEEEDDDAEADDVSITADKLRQLVVASQQENLSMEDTLAQAVAMGVRLPEEVLREVGLPPPSEEALERARDDYSRLFTEWAKEEGLDMSALVNAGNPDGAAGGEGSRGDEEDDEAGEEDYEEAEEDEGAPTASVTTGGASFGAPSHSQPAAPRSWGASLAQPRRPLGPIKAASS